MRVGKNPNRHKDIGDVLPEVLIAVIVHLPNHEGYHAERMEIVQISLRSLRKHAGARAQILVWDNGSCENMRGWLRSFYQPDTLILSHNVGKLNAQASIYRMVPPDTIVAYADDDMLYLPNWLSKQLALLDAFPGPAVISGYPTRQGFNRDNKFTLDWARENAEIKTGDFLPAEWQDDYQTSIGSPGKKLHGKYDDQDKLIIYKNHEAYATSHHCQFVARAGDIVPFKNHSFVTSGTPRENLFDRSLDEAGFLRLATIERLTMHMGNVLDEGLAQIVDHYKLRG